MARTNAYTAEQFIKAIPGTGGVVSKIADKIGCTWHTARKYIDEYATVARAYQDECEKVTDLAESALIKSIAEQEPWAVKYYLSTKGKYRGYAPAADIRQLNVDVMALNDDQLVRLARGEDPYRVLGDPS